MDIEDLAPRPDLPLIALAKEDLGVLSVDELAGRIDALKTEISRVEQALSAKKHSLNAADSVFRKA
ncbi:MAG TPA: DUF1192 domain-containing protein [Alphaproteobacteria bacterium]|nr:DUF1192 domain-containing protein [Alphaproteobacteria bacterium]